MLEFKGSSGGQTVLWESRTRKDRQNYVTIESYHLSEEYIQLFMVKTRNTLVCWQQYIVLEKINSIKLSFILDIVQGY